MRDNELFAFLKPIIDEGLAINNVTAEMTQSFQPTAQGVTPAIQVAAQIISDKEYGWVNRGDTWDEEAGEFVHTESQQVETTFQISCLSLQAPSKPTQKTAKDILKIVKATLVSDETIRLLGLQTMGILRITEIRNPFFRGDKNQWQASPSFDFTITHKQVTISNVQKASPIEGNIYPVAGDIQ